MKSACISNMIEYAYGGRSNSSEMRRTDPFVASSVDSAVERMPVVKR